MRTLLIPLLTAVLMVPSGPVRAEEPIHLEPSTPWVVDYADDSCRLARTFGAGDEKVTLFLDQFQPEAGFYLILGGEPVRVRRDVLDVKVKFRFGPNELEQEDNANTGTLDSDPALLLTSSHRLAPLSDAEKEVRDADIKAGSRYKLPDISLAREAAVKYLQITGTPKEIILETGPMDKALGVLGECAWDTVSDWGLNVEQQKSLTRGPVAKGGSASWFSGNDYPANMARGNFQGTVFYRLIVDEAGRPKSCHVQRSTRPREFDETVCRVVMRRGKFEPALDASGKPVPSYWSQAITFRLEG
jgi:TonB family protein